MSAELSLRPSLQTPLKIFRGLQEQPDVSSLPEFVVSPSLQRPTQDSLPAYEVKFVLTPEQAQGVEEELRNIMMPDPHARADSAHGGYSTTTVYCDTPQWDVYRRLGSFSRRKFRLRRYGNDDVIYLERKSKLGQMRVRKRRTKISLPEMQRFTQTPVDDLWEGDWFQRRALTRSLSPVLAVMYDRVAYVGECADGPLRLTFDRDVRGQAVTDWAVEPFSGGHSILADRVICELKFRGTMPAPFKAVVQSHQLTPGSASKYRLCLDATQILSAPGPEHA